MTDKKYRITVLTEQIVEADSAEAAEAKLHELMDDVPFQLQSIEVVEEEVLYQCDGECGLAYREDEVVSLSGKRLAQSVAPGEIMPLGECPDNECAALIYPPPALCSVVDKYHLEECRKIAHDAYYGGDHVIRGEFLKIVHLVDGLLAPPAKAAVPVQSDCTPEHPVKPDRGAALPWSEDACPRKRDGFGCDHKYANGCRGTRLPGQFSMVCRCPCHSVNAEDQAAR